MRQAVILVGGRGTRLGALARDIPKPLMPVAGVTPFLDYLLTDLARHGISDIVLLAGHLGHVVHQRYHGGRIRDAGVRVVVEPQAAGTAGALRNAAPLLDDVFLMSNGDSLFDINYLALTKVLGPSDVAAMALRRVPDSTRFGRVVFDGGRVRAFHEKDSSFVGEALISAGVYVLRREVLDRIGPPPCSIETDVFPALAREDRLAGEVFDGYFIDIGLPDTLDQARAEVPLQTRRGAIFFDRDGTLIIDNGYTHKLEDLRWQPGAIDAIRNANDAGMLAIVVTNQSGIARGLYTQEQLTAFHAHMQDELRAHGAHIDAFYHAPYHGDGLVAAYALPDHPDRKPRPGMLRRALLEWSIDPERSVVIGDSDVDLAAAHAAGLRGHKVNPGDLWGVVRAELKSVPAPRPVDASTDLRRRAAQAKAWLFDSALPLWWTEGFDQRIGCFHERMRLDGRPVHMERRIRVQARQTAVFARAGRLGWTGPWREAVRAGRDVLLARGLRPDGGTRFKLDNEGRPLDDRRDLYDLAFVVFGLAEAAAALGDDDEAISGATALIDWAEANWTHSEGGFLEGEIMPAAPRRQNPHMHVFEALLSLFEASGERKHLDRASAIARLFRERFFDAQHGALPEYFDEALRPVAGLEGQICEPGHEFEWSWLLHRWARLGGGDMGDIAERLRVHAEVYGLEPLSGFIFDELYVDGRVRTASSRLWPHTERLKANLARHERTRDPNAAKAALQAFDVVMDFCAAPTPGVWRERRDAHGVYLPEDAPASSLYHIMFGMYELVRVTDSLDR
jgi:D-glycero-D-manno-heptose 1,7-bisphosphate phosphatase